MTPTLPDSKLFFPSPQATRSPAQTLQVIFVCLYFLSKTSLASSELILHAKKIFGYITV